jgi:hypothetical protein
LGPLSDIGDCAIRIVGRHRELLLIFPSQYPTIGEHGDLRDGRIIGAAKGRPGGDPAANDFVIVRIDFHAFAARVSHHASCLEQ